MSRAEGDVESENAFGLLLREWRARRRVSQLDLAVEAGVSSRHVSFIETGRAEPMRTQDRDACVRTVEH
jgi:transcriptional regulator with XRE-family HTH domain